MPEETWRLDVRYHALIRDVVQEKERVIFPYIVWEGRVLSRRDFVDMALEKINPVLRLAITLQYRLDEPEKLETFRPRTSQEIRRTAKGKIPHNVNIGAGLKALRSLEISPPFLTFLVPTPEEIAQLKDELERATTELAKVRQERDRRKEDNSRLVGELTEAKQKKQILHEQVEQLTNSRFSSKMRRLFSRSKAVPV